MQAQRVVGGRAEGVVAQAPRRETSAEGRLLELCPPARIYLYLAITAGVAVAGLVVAQAWMLSRLVSRVFVEGQTAAGVWPLFGFMLLLLASRCIFIFAGDVLGQRAAGALKGRLRADLTEHLSALGPTYLRGERSGELVTTAVQGLADLNEYVGAYLPLRALAVLTPLLVASVILVLDPLTVVVLLATGPLLVVFLALIGSRAKELTARRFQEMGLMSAFFLDMLQGLPTLKMFGRSREQVENIRRVSGDYGNTTMRVLRTAFETTLVLELGATLATALVAVEISLRLMAGSVPFDRALAVLIITPEFFLPLRQLSGRYHAGAAGKAAAERVLAILDTPAPEAAGESRSSRPAPRVRGDIRFECVRFSYAGGRAAVLRDFSMTIRGGRRTALIGPTGAGKSTVANLLLHFIEPDGGSITAGGVELSAIDSRSWRSLVACVPQRPHLFYGTVMENLRLARPGASYEEVAAAADAAHAHDFIRRLPRGYETMVGEDGARFSGGEQQRIAIARAFLKDAPILILDEPTSHLDAESRAALMASLEDLGRGKTALVISHDLEIARRADVAFLIEDGGAAEIGAHQLPSFGAGLKLQAVSGTSEDAAL